MSNPLVSVILPCYNAEKFIEASIASIISQTYSNLEIIAIDDSSTDNTFSILQILSKNDNRIKILHNEKNAGLVFSLNKGIVNAKGKYIARMDADDISLPQRIEKQIKFMEQHTDVALCGSGYLIINSENKETGKISLPSENEEIKAALLFTNAFAHPTVVIRKEILERCGLYEEGLVPAEDYELWIRIAENYKIANIPAYLLKYRVHESNLTLTKKENQKHAFEIILNKHAEAFGYAEPFIVYHVKFLNGSWNKRSSIKEIKGFKNWKEVLIEKNSRWEFTTNALLKKYFAKYYSNALLSIIKSKENSILIKLYALQKLLCINPLISASHFIKKIR